MSKQKQNLVNVFDFETDQVKETKGVERKWRGCTLVIARANNADYANFITQKFRENIDELQRFGEDSDEAEALSAKINNEAWCNHILVGWKDIAGPDGKELKYSPENAEMLRSRITDLVKFVNMVSATSENYYIEKLEEDKDEVKK